MLKVNNQVSIPDNEIEIRSIHAQGPGGQNVNKVATAVHLRFDIKASSLPQSYKNRMLKYRDSRISSNGTVIIKSGRFRSRKKNRLDALSRLRELIITSVKRKRVRIRTQPTESSRQSRLDSKSRRSRIKKLRSRNPLYE